MKLADAAARLRHVAGTTWGTRHYTDMNRLAEASEAAAVISDNTGWLYGQDPREFWVTAPEITTVPALNVLTVEV